MMAGRLTKNARAVHNATAFRIFRPEAQRLNSGNRNRSRAHGARLERHPQSAVVEPRSPKSRRRRTNRFDFSVCGGIGRRAHPIATFGDNFFPKRDHRAYRDLARSRSLGGKIECAPHGRWQRKSHRRAASSAQRCCQLLRIISDRLGLVLRRLHLQRRHLHSAFLRSHFD